MPQKTFPTARTITWIRKFFQSMIVWRSAKRPTPQATKPFCTPIQIVTNWAWSSSLTICTSTTENTENSQTSASSWAIWETSWPNGKTSSKITAGTPFTGAITISRAQRRVSETTARIASNRPKCSGHFFTWWKARLTSLKEKNWEWKTSRSDRSTITKTSNRSTWSKNLKQTD